MNHGGTKTLFGFLVSAVLVIGPALTVPFDARADESGEATFTVQDEDAINALKAAIVALPSFADVTEADRPAIEGAQSAYEALSDEDKAIIDADSPPDSSQPYGRLLEDALWGLASLDLPDSSTSLASGTYDSSTIPSLTSTSSKGKSTSPRVRTWNVVSVNVDATGHATCVINCPESSGYTSILTGGTVYPRSTTSTLPGSTFENVPIDLNSTFYLGAASSSMGTCISYAVTTRIDEPISLGIVNNTPMFKVMTASLISDGDGMNLVMALSGTGYLHLYKGTYEQAVANGDDIGNWIDGTLNADGRYEFVIPLDQGETYVPVVAISERNYQSFLNGTGALEQAFYPRQLELDLDALVLTTGDYDRTIDLEVVDNASMADVAAATLHTVGGPNSNAYANTLVMVMGGTGYDQLFVGTAEDAATATDTVWLDGDCAFTFDVGTIGSRFPIALHSTNDDRWHTHILTVDKAGGTLRIEDLLDIGSASIIPIPDQLYTGEEVEPDVTVIYDGVQLSNGSDYSIEYLDNIEKGTATVTVIGAGMYTGMLDTTFEIVGMVYDERWTRLGGADRYATMGLVIGAADIPGHSCDSVVLATGDNFPDALAASALCGALGAPLVLTSKTSLHDDARAAIADMAAPDATVYILGSEAAVSSVVEESVRAMGLSTVRLAGADRIGTGLAIAEAGAGRWGDTCIIATSSNYPDSLGIGPWAYAARAPLFGTVDGVLTDEEVEAIGHLGFDNVLVLGDDAVVDLETVTEQLRGTGVEHMTRLAGANRYATNIQVVQWTTGALTTGGDVGFQPSVALSLDGIGAATGDNFPDALASVTLLGPTRSALLLVNGSPMGLANIETIITPGASQIRHGWVLGGPPAVSTEVEQALFDAVS